MANVSGGTSDSCGSNEKSNEDLKSKGDKCNGESSKSEISKESVTPKTSNMKSYSSSRILLKSSKLQSPSFGSPSTPSKPFVLNPPKLSNPFFKAGKDEKDESKSGDNKDEDSCSTPKASEKTDNSSTPLSKTGMSFVPLGAEASTPSQPTSFSAASTPSLGFVFGQNIHEKVEAATPAESATVAEEPSPSKAPQEVTTNGTSSEMLFSVQVPKENADKNCEAKSLSEAAREYEEARAVKRRYEEVPVLTGEEEEANVLQINCKLFSWSSCSWTERGRGTLRVNDLPTSPGIHRLIVRTAGSLRVVLNTKIWSGMTVDRASSKSLRITGMDSNGIVKVFLVTASPKETDQLQKCLEWRVNNLKKSDESSPKKVRQDDS